MKWLRHGRWALRVLPALCGVAFVVWLVRRGDSQRLWQLFTHAGPRLLWALPPFLFGLLVDTIGWRIILTKIGARTSFGRLFRIRVATEGLTLLVPGGALAADVLRPVLLRSQFSIPLPVGAASLVLKKALALIAEALYVGLGMALGPDLQRRMGMNLGLVKLVSWPLLPAGVALVLAALAIIMVVAITRAPAPSASLHEARGKAATAVAATRTAAHAFLRAHPSTWVLVTALFLGQWLSDGSETWVMARLIGLDANLGSAWAFDSLSGLLRSIFFFLPAGIGIQDAALILFAQSSGAHDAATAGAALLLTKRAKEVFWIVTAFSLMPATSEGDGTPEGEPAAD